VNSYFPFGHFAFELESLMCPSVPNGKGLDWVCASCCGLGVDGHPGKASSSSLSLVPVMKSTGFREFNHRAKLGRLNGTSTRSVFGPWQSAVRQRSLSAVPHAYRARSPTEEQRRARSLRRSIQGANCLVLEVAASIPFAGSYFTSFADAKGI